MDGVSLKSRAVAFAFWAGAVAFFLAMLATTQAVTAIGLARALIPALVCGAFSWAAAERTVSTTASAIDQAIERLSLAGEGDLASPTPPAIAAVVPKLSRAMDALFKRMRANFDGIERLAMFDAVTALPNRTHFRDRAEALLGPMSPAQTAALLFIDLDRFKAVNDTKGHAVGDQLLGQVGRRLQAVAAQSGLDAPLAGRLAGDEFTLLLPSVSPARAEEVGGQVLRVLEQPFEIGGAQLRIGASIGVAIRPDHGVSLTDLMRAADVAMYHAKASGRGRVEVYSERLAARIADRDRLDADLRDAVSEGQFELLFQPQVNARHGGVVAAEALLRWRHPTDGLRLPGTFIARAEETGLIVAIGDAMVDGVARTAARWAARGHAHRLAINVSRRQIDDPAFFRQLARALAEAGAPARAIELEIDETLAMRMSAEVTEALGTLRVHGTQVSVGGFGSGLCTIARLRDLPVDRVKLDRALVADIAVDAKARAIAQAVVGLIHGLGCEAVGEGVETAAQAEMLRVIGCDVIQGYAVAPPMEEGALLSWIEAASRTRAITSA